MKKHDLVETTEGTTKVWVYKNKHGGKGPGKKNKHPFYNPSMELNRDLSILVAQWLVDKSKKHVCLLDGLAASGVRGIRFANEIKGDFDVVINNVSEDAFFLIKKNIRKYEGRVVATCENLHKLVIEKKFDYIDIDPFGSPVFFIDSAVRNISNNGVIACTATDTATLCGLYPDVCLRRYFAKSYRSPVMHEIGLRILIASICRKAAMYDKGIKPIVSVSTDHYFRVYLQIKKGKKFANESINKVSLVKPEDFFFYNPPYAIGPLWLGNLHDKKTLEHLRDILLVKKLGKKKELWKLLDVLIEESEAPLFFYTSEYFASQLKTSPPRLETVFKKIKNQGFSVSKTHFSPVGFKTDAPVKTIEEIFRDLKF